MYLYIVLLVLCWTLNPFVKKKVMSAKTKSGGLITPEDFLLVSNIIAVLTIVGVFLIVRNHNIAKTIKDLSFNHWALFGLNALVSLTATFLFVFVLNKGQITRIIPTIQSSVIFFTFLLAWLFLGEKIDHKKIIGVALLCIGIILMNI